MKLIILRHWRTKENDAWILQWQSIWWELTIEWIIQAQKAWIYLKNYNIDKIYSSDLKRTIDTTKYVLENVICNNLNYTKELREVNLWVAEWKHKSEVTKEDLYSWESDEELEIRAKNFIIFLKENEINKNILIVTHNTIAKFLIKEILENKTDVLFLEKWIKNSSISIFNYFENKFQIEVYNSVKHLE